MRPPDPSPAPAALPLLDRIAAGLVGLWALLVTALFATTRLPFIDLPQHAVTLAMLRDPARYGEVYRSQLVPWTTNSLWFTLDALWSWALSAEASLTLCAWLAVVGLPAALAAWARSWGGQALPAALLGCALAWSRPLFWGFAHYALSFPVAVATLALDRALQERGAGRRSWRLWGLGLLAVALFLVHSQTFAFTLGAVGLQRLVGALVGAPPSGGLGARLRDLAGRLGQMAAAWAPALALFGLWVRANLVAPSEAEAPLGTLSAGLGARYQAPADALGALTLSLQGFIKRTLVDDIAAIGLLALGVLGLIGVLVQAARGRDRGALAAALACGGVALTALLLYLFMPQHIQGQYYLSTRMAPWIPLALAPLVALAPVPGWARWARLGATGGLAALALGGVGFAFSTFASEAAPVDRLLAQVEPEKRLMLWAGTRSSRALPSNPFTHYLSWTAAETGGTTTFSFASFRPNPVVYRDRDAAQRSIPGEEFKAWCTAFAGQAQDVDYVVTRGADKAPRKLCNATRHYADQLERVAADGEWALYRVTAPLPAMKVRGCSCPSRR